MDRGKPRRRRRRRRGEFRWVVAAAAAIISLGLLWTRREHPSVLPSALPRELVIAPPKPFKNQGCAPCRGTTGRVTLVTAYDASADREATMERLLRRQVESIKAYLDPEGVAAHWVVCSARTNLSRAAAKFPAVRVASELDVEPSLARFDEHRGDEYSGDGKLRSRRGRIVQMIVKLVAYRLARTNFYAVLDADVFVLRPTAFCDLVAAGVRGIASFSPEFSRRNATLVDPLRSIGQFGRWIRRSGDVLGIDRVAATGFYGVTPAVLSSDVVRALVEFLERRHGTKEWWRVARPGWTEYGLYFLFLEALGLADRVHERCDGQLYSANAWTATPKELYDAHLMAAQRYTVFGVWQSLRRDEPAVASSSLRSPTVSESKRRVLAHWEMLERATDRTLDDLRPPDGTETIDLEAYATYVSSDADIPGACATARELGRLRRPHVAVVDAVVSSDDQLRSCFGAAVINAPPISGLEPDERHYGIIHLFSLARFDKIVHVGPGAVVRASDEDALFDTPGLAAAPDRDDPKEFTTDFMVVQPNRRFSYLPLLATLRAMKYESRAQFFKKGGVSFLNFAFPKWRRRHLPRAFYLPPSRRCNDTALQCFVVL